MRNPTIILLLAVSMAAGAAFAVAEENGSNTREIGRTTEKELKVSLSSAFGTVLIGRGESGKILMAEASADKSESNVMDVEYAIRNRVGFLSMTLGEQKVDKDGNHYSFNLDRFDKGKWFLRFSEAIPISFDIELGVGRGDFNLSGLDVKDFNLSTGASDVTLAFDQANTGTIENMNIESGVSKFDARNLGNANFRHLRFQGGMGSYTLDFGGELKNEVDVDIEVGLGLVTIIIPEDIGARVIYENSWVSRLDCDHDFQPEGENQYISANYHKAQGRMNINIDSGLGSIKVRRR
jgi:hypothetical protein